MRALLLALQLAAPERGTAAAPVAVADSAARQLRYEFSVAAPRADVWRAWTTDAGLRSFFGPAASIEPRTFGKFEIHFAPTARAGERGAEGNVVLAMEPERMLTVTWDAPPKYPAIRAQRTFLEIRLDAVDNATTRVRLTHSGFGHGEEWEQVYRYFHGAWTWVAAALQYRFDEGPIDWSAPPDLGRRMETIGGVAARAWPRNR